MARMSFYWSLDWMCKGAGFNLSKLIFHFIEEANFNSSPLVIKIFARPNPLVEIETGGGLSFFASHNTTKPSETKRNELKHGFKLTHRIFTHSPILPQFEK